MLFWHLAIYSLGVIEKPRVYGCLDLGFLLSVLQARIVLAFRHVAPVEVHAGKDLPVKGHEVVAFRSSEAVSHQLAVNIFIHCRW